MAKFSVNAQRFDPYKNFKFRVKWDGRYVAGVSKVGALKRTTEVVDVSQRWASSAMESPAASAGFARKRSAIRCSLGRSSGRMPRMRTSTGCAPASSRAASRGMGSPIGDSTLEELLLHK